LRSATSCAPPCSAPTCVAISTRHEVTSTGLVAVASPTELDRHVRALGAQISADHPQGVTLVGVLKGSVVFLSDLARHVTVPTRIELLAVAPYDGAARRTRVVKDLDRAVTGESLVLVNGIVDTGLTSDFLVR